MPDFAFLSADMKKTTYSRALWESFLVLPKEKLELGVF